MSSAPRPQSDIETSPRQDGLASPWLRGMPRSLTYPSVGIDALLSGAARAYPQRVALQDGATTFTYPELEDAARRVAGGLRERGIRPGDAVALHMPNTWSFIVAYYGALCAGAAVAPVNPAQPIDALRQQLEDVAAKAVVTSPLCLDAAVAARTPEIELLVCVPGPDSVEPESLPADVVALSELTASDPLDGYAVDPDLVAHLQLTGGTTGRSKAVRVLHRNLVASVVQNACWRATGLVDLDDQGGLRITQVPEAVAKGSLVPGAGIYLAVPPFFHGLGLVGHNIEVLLGSTVVVPDGGFSPDGFLSDVERYGVTHIVGSPAMYYALMRSPTISQRDLSSVSLLVCGAAPIDTSALKALGDTFANAFVIEGYGLSEATMGVSGSGGGVEPLVPAGSIGVPLFDTEVEIRDTDGQVLPDGVVGELWVRGPQVADGYEGHPELSAAQFRDGWLATGDSGRSEDGFLYLVGRSKDLIIYKGYNVYPQPLEEILCSHPAVYQAAVVGQHSEAVGEIPVGFVVLRPGAQSYDGLAEEIMAHLADKVAPYQRVREVHVLEALPVTPTGKIRKVDLRERLA
ncbi:class I adenylate-forming enzyme family protein [Mumia sp. Pv 4-285]|uniref:class I adenylate-forming enzyme family protein n=1 Tax=Mumia qirimensis TaxID=3234852 RepID=UPI00351CD2DC